MDRLICKPRLEAPYIRVSEVGLDGIIANDARGEHTNISSIVVPDTEKTLCINKFEDMGKRAGLHYKKHKKSVLVVKSTRAYYIKSIRLWIKK